MNYLTVKSAAWWRQLRCAAGVAVIIHHLPAAAQDAGAPASSADPGGVDLKLGPFDFQPRVDSSVKYDDNILFSRTPQSDEIWDLAPGVQAVAGDKLSLLAVRDDGGDPYQITPDELVANPPESWPGSWLIVNESPGFEWYTDHQQNNYIGNTGGFSALMPRTKFILGAKLDEADQPVTVVEAGQRATEQSLTATLSGAYFISDKTAVDTAASVNKLDYQGVGLVGYTEWSDVTWLNYQWSALLNVSAGITAGLDDVPDHNGQQYGQGQLRARYQYAEKLSFKASAGYEIRHYDSGIADTVEPIFDFGSTYHVGERTTLGLDGNRGVSAAVIGGAIYTTTAATVSLDQGFTDRLSIQLSGSYSYYQPQAALPGSTIPYSNANYFSTRLTGVLQITRRLVGQVFYNYRAYEPNPGTGITDDIAGLELTWKY